MLSIDTLNLFQGLLNRVNVNAAEPDFEEAAAMIVKAKKELAAAIEAASPAGA